MPSHTHPSVELSAMGEVSWEQELNENQGGLVHRPSIHPSMMVVHLWVGGSLWLKLHGSTFNYGGEEALLLLEELKEQ